MRDLEFLPAWYPRLRQSWRMLCTQTLLACGVIAYVAWCTAGSRARVASASAQAGWLDRQIATQNNGANESAQVIAQVRQLLRGSETLSQIRAQTPLSRLIQSVVDAVPPGIRLTKLEVLPPDAAASIMHPAAARVDLAGLAPRVADVANCQAAISRLTFVSNVRLDGARDLPGPGAVSREFEMTFALTPDAN
jgi:Tfp pilus assembly protein PilN